MQTLQGVDQLRARITELEQNKEQEWKEIKVRIRDQYEKLKPANFIRNVFEDLSESLNLKADMLQAGIGLTAGLVVKALLSKSKNKPLKKWLKIIIIYAITAYVSKNRDAIIELGSKGVQFVTEMIQKAKEGSLKEQSETEEEEAPNESPESNLSP